MAGCRSCLFVQRRDAGLAPDGDAIARFAHWDVVHAMATSVEGWLVLVLRRHLTALADLSQAEAAELGLLVRSASQALAEVVGCEKTYMAQFAEHPDHQHVHVHVVPRPAGSPPEHLGPAVFQRLEVPVDEQVSEARRDELALRLRAALPSRGHA